MKTLMIPKEDAGGIYEIERDGWIVTIRMWEKDSSWSHPGRTMLVFDVGNSVVQEMDDKLNIFDWNVLIQYLTTVDELGASTYMYADIKERGKKSGC